MPGLLKEDLTAFGSSDLLPSPLLDSLLSRHYHQLQHLRQQQENSSADAVLKDGAASYCSSPRSFLHAGGNNGGLNGMNPSSRFIDFGSGKEEMLLASPGRSSNNNSSNSNNIGLNLDLKELQQAAAAAASSGFNPFSDATGSPCDSPLSTIGALQRFLPSNNEDSWTAEHVYSCDEFRMFEFKVRRCMRGRSHDWTECPFAHPGEKARRRDPRRFHYSGTACPDFRKGHCKNGDACELAHGVFECWLHPARYRTQPCKDGRNCKRRVCFFAHTPEQLRLPPPPPPPPPSSKAEQNALLEQLMIQQQQQGFERSYDGFLGENHRFLQQQQQSSVAASPTSTLVGLAQSPPPLSPPLSPGSSSESPPMSPCSPSPQQQQAMAAAIARNVALLRASSPHLSAQAAAHHEAQAFLAASATAPPSQRQLERINSMPGAAMSAAMSAEQRSRLLGSFSNSFNGRPNVNSLVAALRHMELKGEGAAAYSAPTAACCGGYSACSSSSPSPPASPSWIPAAGRSPLYRSSDCGRSTVSAMGRQQQPLWGMDHYSGNEDAARVESGRDLRAKVYGKISMENLPDSGDSPDLGWVSELVTEN